MDERILEHLKHLNRYSLLLEEIRRITCDDFKNNPIYQGSAERFLQLAIESCLNIGNRIISLYQLKKPVKTPETYADIFDGLSRIGAVDLELSKRLVKMAKFRNRLVHLYWDIDPEMIYQFLKEDMEDFKKFQDQVVFFCNRNRL